MQTYIVITAILHGVCGLTVYDGSTVKVSATRNTPGTVEVSWVGHIDVAYRFQPRTCDKPTS